MNFVPRNCRQSNIVFDGQVLGIPVQIGNGYPITLCRLQQIVCQDPRKLSKKGKCLIAL